MSENAKNEKQDDLDYRMYFLEFSNFMKQARITAALYSGQPDLAEIQQKDFDKSFLKAFMLSLINGGFTKELHGVEFTADGIIMGATPEIADWLKVQTEFANAAKNEANTPKREEQTFICFLDGLRPATEDEIQKYVDGERMALEVQVIVEEAIQDVGKLRAEGGPTKNQGAEFKPN